MKKQCTILLLAWFLVCQRTNIYAQYESSIYDLTYNFAYQRLKLRNADVNGWITIPGTEVDYPIMQGHDNDFYLHHNPIRKADAKGSVFLDYRNDPSFSDVNTILYGHNIQGSNDMFSTLLRYEDQYFYERYPYIIIAQDDVIHYYKIFAAYTTSTSFYYLHTSLSENGLSSFTRDIILRNQLDPLITYRMDDRLLTLSTCSFRFSDSRFVIHAYRIHRRELANRFSSS